MKGYECEIFPTSAVNKNDETITFEIYFYAGMW